MSLSRRGVLGGGLALLSLPALGYTKTTATMWAGLGDSLTAGALGEGWPWPGRLDAALSPDIGVANNGKLGNTISQISSRWTSFIKDEGYVGVALLGGINDILAGTAGATVWTTYEALVDDILGDSLVVIAMTCTPFGQYPVWSSGKQTELEALNTAILAKSATDYHTIDLYTLMGKVGTPTDLAVAYDWGDGLHFSEVGMAYVATQLGAVIPGWTP